MTLGAPPPALVDDPARTLALMSAEWRVVETPAADGVTNMAVDAALLDEARQTGVGTLRLYAWTRPTLSLGRHERARGRFDPARLACEGVDVVRRITGGRALLHDHELTYAVAGPTGGSSPAARRRAIRAVLTQALGSLGVTVAVANAPERTLRPGRGACFSEPSRGELVVAGAKLVASAQLDEEGAFLQHGSILLADDQRRIAALASEPDFPETRATSLADALGREVPYSDVSHAVRAAFVSSLTRAGVTRPPLGESFRLDSPLVVQHRARFLDASWTWAR